MCYGRATIQFSDGLAGKCVLPLLTLKPAERHSITATENAPEVKKRSVQFERVEESERTGSVSSSYLSDDCNENGVMSEGGREKVNTAQNQNRGCNYVASPFGRLIIGGPLIYLPNCHATFCRNWCFFWSKRI